MHVAGRKVAIDASMSIYQFLIAVRHDGGTSLTNDAGDTTRLFKSASFYFYARLSTHVFKVFGFMECCCFTNYYISIVSFSYFSHLMGMFYRTLRLVDNGIKPCYVFDGKPPDMKSGEVTTCDRIVTNEIYTVATVGHFSK